MSGSASRDAGGPIVRWMTVARVREPAGADHAEVTFLESARFYQLPKSNPAYRRSLDRLERAQADGEPVSVRLPSIDSDLIDAVEPAAEGDAGR